MVWGGELASRDPQQHLAVALLMVMIEWETVTYVWEGEGCLDYVMNFEKLIPWQ